MICYFLPYKHFTTCLFVLFVCAVHLCDILKLHNRLKISIPAFILHIQHFDILIYIALPYNLGNLIRIHSWYYHRLFHSLLRLGWAFCFHFTDWKGKQQIIHKHEKNNFLNWEKNQHIKNRVNTVKPSLPQSVLQKIQYLPVQDCSPGVVSTRGSLGSSLLPFSNISSAEGKANMIGRRFPVSSLICLIQHIWFMNMFH